MKKRITSGILALCMLISLFPVTAFATYDDIAGHWGEEAIERWSDYGIVEGDGKNFNPDGLMSRGAAAAVFARLLGLSEKADISKYSDVNADAWYADAIAMCVEAGIMSGVAGNLMDPNGPLTREQFFVMYVRALGIEEEETMNKSFDDSDEISDWAQGSINALVNKGFIDGISDDILAPDVDINRASVMSLLDKSIAAYVNEDNAEVTVEGDGIILVVADNVTIKGEGDITLVAATDGKVDLKDFEGDVEVNIVSDGAEIENVPEDTKLNVKEGIEDAKVNDKVVDKDTTEAPAPAPGGSIGGGSIGGGTTGGGSTGGQPEGGNPEGGNPEGGNPETKLEVKPATGITSMKQTGMTITIGVDLPQDMTGIDYFTLSFYDSVYEESKMTGITCSKDHPYFYVDRDKFDTRYMYDTVEIVSMPMDGYEKAVYTESVSVQLTRTNLNITPYYEAVLSDGNTNRLTVKFDQPAMNAFMHTAIWENANEEYPIDNDSAYSFVEADGMSVYRSASEAEIAAINAGTALVGLRGWHVGQLEQVNGKWTISAHIYEAVENKAVEVRTPTQPELPTEIENIRLEMEDNCLVLKWDAVKDADGYKIEFTTDNGITWGGSNNTSDTHVDLCFLTAGVYNGVKITAKQGNTELTTKEDKTVSFTIDQSAALEWDNINISLEKVENNKYDMEITGLAAYAHYEVKFTPETATGGYSAFSSDADADGKATSTIGSSNLDDYVANGYISIFIHASANVSADGKTGSVLVNKTADKKYADLQSGAQNGNLHFETNANTGLPDLIWDVVEGTSYYKVIFTPYATSTAGTTPVEKIASNNRIILHTVPINGYEKIKVIAVDANNNEIASFEENMFFRIDTEPEVNTITNPMAVFSAADSNGYHNVAISGFMSNSIVWLELFNENGEREFDCMAYTNNDGKTNFNIGNPNADIAGCIAKGTYSLTRVETLVMNDKSARIKFWWNVDKKQCATGEENKLSIGYDNRNIPVLTWDAVTGAQVYKLIFTPVDGSGAGTNPVERSTSKASMYLNTLPANAYKSIKLIALDADGNEIVSSEEDFHVGINTAASTAAKPTVTFADNADGSYNVNVAGYIGDAMFMIEFFDANGNSRNTAIWTTDANGNANFNVPGAKVADCIANGKYSFVGINFDYDNQCNRIVFEHKWVIVREQCSSAPAVTFGNIRCENQNGLPVIEWDSPSEDYKFTISLGTSDANGTSFIETHNTRNSVLGLNFVAPGVYNFVKVYAHDNNGQMVHWCEATDLTITVNKGDELQKPTVEISPVANVNDEYTLEIEGLTANVTYNIIFKNSNNRFSFCGVSDADGKVERVISDNGLSLVMADGKYSIVELQNISVSTKSATFERRVRAADVACTDTTDYKVSNIRFTDTGDTGLYLNWDKPANLPAGDYEYWISVYDNGTASWKQISSTKGDRLTCAIFDIGNYDKLMIETYDINNDEVVGSYVDEEISLVITGEVIESANIVFTPVTGSATPMYQYEISGTASNVIYYLKMYDSTGKGGSANIGRTDAQGTAIGTPGSKNFAEYVETGYYLIQQVVDIQLTNNAKTASFVLKSHGVKQKYNSSANSIIKSVTFAEDYGGFVYLNWTTADDDYNQYKYKVYLSNDGGTSWTLIDSTTAKFLNLAKYSLKTGKTYNAVKFDIMLDGAIKETVIDKQISLNVKAGTSVSYPSTTFTKYDDGEENVYYTGKVALDVKENYGYMFYLYSRVKEVIYATEMIFSYGSGVKETTISTYGIEQKDAVENGYYEIISVNNINIDATGKSASYNYGKTNSLIACTPSDALDLKIEIMEGADNISVSFNKPMEYDSVKLVVRENYGSPLVEAELTGNHIPDLAEYIPQSEYGKSYNVELIGVRDGVKEDIIAEIPVTVAISGEAYEYDVKFGIENIHHRLTLQPMQNALKLLVNFNSGKNRALYLPASETEHTVASEMVLTDGDYISVSAILSAVLENGAVKLTMTPASQKYYEEVGQAYINASLGDIIFGWDAHPKYTEFKVGNSNKSLTYKTTNTHYSLLNFIVEMNDKTSMDVYVKPVYGNGVWAELEDAIKVKDGEASNVNLEIVGQPDGTYMFKTTNSDNVGRMFVFEMVDPNGKFMAGYNGYNGDTSTPESRIYVMPDELINIAPYEGCTFNVYQYDWICDTNTDSVAITRSYETGIGFTAYEDFAAETEVTNELMLIEALNKSGTVKLMNDITLTYETNNLNVYVNRGGAVTLDLNGYNLKLVKNVDIYVANGKQMTIKNGTISGYVAGEGEDVEGVDSSSKIHTYGGVNLELLDGTFVNVDAGGCNKFTIKNSTVKGYVKASVPQFTMDGCVVDSVTTGGKTAATEIKNSTIGDIRIDNGNNAVVSNVTLGKCVVSSGTATLNDLALTGIISFYGRSVITINGGTYVNSNVSVHPDMFDDDCTVIINSGTFNFKPKDEYLANGKTATDNGNGTWTVQ